MTNYALHTDHYELTMLQAAIADGSVNKRCVFEVFTRKLPENRAYGVVAGTQRVVEALQNFRFEGEYLKFLRENNIVNKETYDFLSNYDFKGNLFAYPEGELFFPFSPVLTIEGTFADVILETLILSILNYDSAVASAASRMVHAANGRTMIEMGSRRTNEESAVVAARAAYIAGFDKTSNLEAGRRYGIPTTGTAAHAWTLLHEDEKQAFEAQVASLGVGTTLLIDTYDVAQGLENAISAVGPKLGGVRIDSGNLAANAKMVRTRLNEMQMEDTRIVVTSDLDEYKIAYLASAPIDVYGIGTSLVTGSGHPNCGFVYKLVEVDGRPVAKASSGKISVGGRKHAYRGWSEDDTMSHEFVLHSPITAHSRLIPNQVCFLYEGKTLFYPTDIEIARDVHAYNLARLPDHAHDLYATGPAIPTVSSYGDL